MEMLRDDIDWLEAGYDDLDTLNYYLIQTVREDYIRGYPEDKEKDRKRLEKMQKYVAKHK